MPRAYRFDDVANTVATKSVGRLSGKAYRGSSQRFSSVRSTSEEDRSVDEEDSMIEERYSSYVDSLKRDQSRDKRYPALLSFTSMEEESVTGKNDDTSIIDLTEDISTTEDALSGCTAIFSDRFWDTTTPWCFGTNASCPESYHPSSPAASISSTSKKEYSAKLLARSERIIKEKDEALHKAHVLHGTLTATNDSTVKTLIQRCQSLQALNRRLQAEIEKLHDQGNRLKLKYKELQSRVATDPSCENLLQDRRG